MIWRNRYLSLSTKNNFSYTKNPAINIKWSKQSVGNLWLSTAFSKRTPKALFSCWVRQNKTLLWSVSTKLFCWKRSLCRFPSTKSLYKWFRVHNDCFFVSQREFSSSQKLRKWICWLSLRFLKLSKLTTVSMHSTIFWVTRSVKQWPWWTFLISCLPKWYEQWL